MKNQVKKIVAIAICSVMLFGTLPMNGMADFDFSKLNLFGRINLSGIGLVDFSSVFSLKAKAAEITDSGTCGKNLTWTLDNEGTLTIAGEGGMYDYYVTNDNINVRKYTPWYNFRYKIKTVIIKNGVTKIGRDAFSTCSNLAEVIISDSITSIGDSAFKSCNGLTSVDLGKGVEEIKRDAFQACTELKSITISDSTTSIGAYAFKSCTNLASVNLGNGVIDIGCGAFQDCTGLTIITIPDNTTNIDNHAFNSCVSLKSVSFGNGVKSIGKYAFKGCTCLTEITIPNSITSVSNDAFYSCTGLRTVNYEGTIDNWVTISFGNAYSNPIYYSNCLSLYNEQSLEFEPLAKVFINEATTINNYAFYNLKVLTSVVISNSVTRIGESAFKNCTGLTEITIPNSIISVSNDAFYSCTGLRTVNYEGTIDNWATISFGNAYSNPIYYSNGLSLYNEQNSEFEPLTNVVINEATTINNYAFYNLKALTSVVISNSVTSIGGSAFSGCVNLAEITISDSVTIMGEGVFSGCSKLKTAGPIGGNYNIKYSWSEHIPSYAFCNSRTLTKITIPSSVTSIGVSAFNNCTSLTEITIPNSITNVDKDAFNSCTGLRTVNYEGTIDNWATISFGNAYSNPIYYSNGLSLYNEQNSEFEPLTKVVINEATTINNYAFCNLKALTSVVISNSVTSIGVSAFNNCTGLTEITIPNSVTIIGRSAFYGCTGLTEIIIPNNVTNIGSFAFYKCAKLKSVTLGNGLKSIGLNAFLDCSSLTKTYYTGTVDNWCSIEFEGSYKHYHNSYLNKVADIYGNPIAYSKGLYIYNEETSEFELLTDVVISEAVSIGNYSFAYCESIKRVTILDGATSIGDGAFCGCSKLESVYIPNSITSIGAYSFSDCLKLESVDISENVTEFKEGVFFYCYNLRNILIPSDTCLIAYMAFCGCFRLEDIVIPDYVESIGAYAFSGCRRLKSIDVPASVTLIGNNAFAGVINVDITKTTLNDSSGNYPWGANNINGEKDGCLIFRPGSDRQVLIACLTEATGEITIPEGVTAISNNAFAYCTGISAVNIPDSVTDIGENAFYAVLNIKHSENMTATGSPWGTKGVNAYVDGIFAYYDEGTKRVLVGCSCSASGSVIVPDTVREVGDLAFAECKEITSVTFTTDGVIDFGRDVFAGCSKLDSVSTGNNTVDDITYTTVSVANVNANGPGLLGASPDDNGVKYTEEKGILFCNRNKKGTFDVSDAKEVTFICENAFANCTGLTVSISSDNITSIGKDAFFNSGSYVKWNKEGVFAIDNYVIDANKEITSYEVPGSAVCIADEAFADCKNLSSLTFEDNDGISIGKRAFEGCSLLSALGNITGVRILRMGAYALENSECYSTYKQEDGLVYLGSCVADADEGITQANIKAGTTCIAEGAFSDCVNLTSVTIPDSISRIDENAFLACVSLTNISLPSSLRYLGRYAFKDCINLTEITIPAKVNKIGDYAFYGCLSLKSFDVENGNSNYSAKDGVLFDKSGSTLIQYPAGKTDTGYNVAEEVTKLSSLSFRKCTNLENVIVPESIKYGYRNPFEGCSAEINGEDIIYSESGDIKTLVYVSKSEISELGGKFTVPADVTHIGANAFAGCKELTEIVFAENSSLISIGEEAFKDCTGLTDIKLPANLKTIGEQAFLNCANLENVEFGNPENIEAIYDYAFAGCNMDCDSSTNEGKEAIRDKFGFTDGMQMQEYSFHRHKTPEGSAEPVTVTAATCVKPGLEKMSCIVCGKDYYNDIPPLGHNFTDYIYNNDATAEKDGTKTAKCSRCDATDTITAEGTKELSNYTIGYTYSDDYSECTLTAVSKTDESIIEKQTVPASIKETKPTCTEDGSITYTYTFDGMFAALSHSKTVAVPSPGHSFTDYKYNNDATTEKDGTETARCDRCAATDTRPKAGTKLTAAEEPYATTIEISNYTATKKVDYKTTITFKAEVKNSAGSEIIWYVNGQKVGTGETFTVNKATESFTVYCVTKDASGNEVKSHTETVNVDNGFFARLVAFFKSLFGLLPNITQ